MDNPQIMRLTAICLVFTVMVGLVQPTNAYAAGLSPARSAAVVVVVASATGDPAATRFRFSPWAGTLPVYCGYVLDRGQWRRFIVGVDWLNGGLNVENPEFIDTLDDAIRPTFVMLCSHSQLASGIAGRIPTEPQP